MSFHFFRWPRATSSFTTPGFFRGSSSRPCLGCSRSSLCRCCKGEKRLRCCRNLGDRWIRLHHSSLYDMWFGWFGYFGFVSFKHIPNNNSGSSTNLDISWEFSEGHIGNLSVSSSSEKQSSWEKFKCREMAGQSDGGSIRMAGRFKNSNFRAFLEELSQWPIENTWRFPSILAPRKNILIYTWFSEITSLKVPFF